MDQQNTMEKTESPVRALNSADRCDSCAAQAYVRVTLSTGSLLFCLHHANENRAILEPLATTWHDESKRLLVR